ncbi:hypothetical protein [Amycolatopsis magusensis]|uniref:hypothetical protein n=1 Tax=Amycolatopsis magusensis TaxID=882444 RepID=UPI0024A96341|nr:hypothetical protein [Amycolatopsis magusensis]MDI5975471.1 hypothetical protein [Amycolatopsis magusensis]
MAQDDREFDEWLAEHNAAFDTAMRENTRTAEVLQAITARAASETEQEIEQRVVVAAATGQPLSPEPHWPEDRWRRANIDYAKLVRGIDAAQQRNWMFVCATGPSAAWLRTGSGGPATTTSPTTTNSSPPSIAGRSARWS